CCVSCCRDHRVLGSFPARRSSDLLWAMKDGRLEEVFAETLAVRTKSFVGLTPDYSSVVFLETDEQTGRSDYFLLNVASGTIAKADRKSTRLNSSHVKISYAVFCLK